MSHDHSTYNVKYFKILFIQEFESLILFSNLFYFRIVLVLFINAILYAKLINIEEIARSLKKASKVIEKPNQDSLKAISF